MGSGASSTPSTSSSEDMLHHRNCPMAIVAFLLKAWLNWAVHIVPALGIQSKCQIGEPCLSRGDRDVFALGKWELEVVDAYPTAVVVIPC